MQDDYELLLERQKNMKVYMNELEEKNSQLQKQLDYLRGSTQSLDEENPMVFKNMVHKISQIFEVNLGVNPEKLQLDDVLEMFQERKTHLEKGKPNSDTNNEKITEYNQ